MPSLPSYRTSRRESIRGNVTPYIAEYEGISDDVKDAVRTLTEKKAKTEEARAAYMAALAKVPLHHSEDAYKQRLVDKFQQEIDYDPFDFTRVQKLATQYASDPELMAKARTYQEYLGFTNDVEEYRKSGKIESITAERLLNDASNQYKFTPTYDGDKIVGGQEWKPGRRPVAHKNRVEILAMAANFAKPFKGSNSNQTQSSVTNADGTGKGSMSKHGEQFETLPEEAIKEVFKGVFQAIPGAEDSLLQDYYDDEYKLTKYADEIKKAKNSDDIRRLEADRKVIQDRLYDENGMKRSSYEYMKYSMNLITPHMAYDYRFIDNASSSSIDNSAKGTGGSGGLGGLGGLELPGGITFGDLINATSLGGTVVMKGFADSVELLSGVMTTLSKSLSGASYTDSSGKKHDAQNPAYDEAMKKINNTFKLWRH